MFSGRIPTEELDLAIANHARWIKTAGREGKRLDLSGKILNGKNLSRLDLRAAILRGTQLSWANFSYSNLSDADLCGAVMNHAVLIDANLAGANLNGVNLRCSDLTRTNFQDTTLLYADMRGSISEENPAPQNLLESMSDRKPAKTASDGQRSSLTERIRRMISTCSDSLTITQPAGNKSLVPYIYGLLKPKSIKTV